MYKNYLLKLLFLIACCYFGMQNTSAKHIVFHNDTFTLSRNEILLKGFSTEYELQAQFPLPDSVFQQIIIELNQYKYKVKRNNLKLIIETDYTENQNLVFNTDYFNVVDQPVFISGIYTILPPLIAIIFALILKEVITALFLGILSGMLIIQYTLSGIYGIPKAFSALFDDLLLNALNHREHLAVILFSMMIGGMVSLISKNGGMQAAVSKIARFAKTPKQGQLVTWFLGIAIFFDDYANTLIVGNTMRPVTDKLKISREKLSYLVDSTAAPVAAIAFITTWIGAELGYINDSIGEMKGFTESAYSVFIQSLPYAFYPILTIVFMLILILQEKDFGPMLKAEIEARNNPEKSYAGHPGSESINEFEQQTTSNAWFAIIPVFTLLFVTGFGLIFTGFSNDVWNNENIGFITKISTIIGNANSYTSLIWGASSGLLTALILTTFSKKLKLHDSINAMTDGFKSMLPAIMILLFAWTLAELSSIMQTADYITGSLMKMQFSPYFMPLFTFIISGVIAFSTGSSWGTMAIIFPLILPASWNLSLSVQIDSHETYSLIYQCTAAVLAGAVLGDHCSPISDTTILSSLASSCNHMEHVKTQLPYSLTVGSISIFLGIIPAAFGISSIVLFPLAILVLYLIVWKFGKKTALN